LYQIINPLMKINPFIFNNHPSCTKSSSTPSTISTLFLLNNHHVYSNHVFFYSNHVTQQQPRLAQQQPRLAQNDPRRH
jgi:hypothetical protein